MRAYLAANYAIGDPADSMVEVSSSTCQVCGGMLDPLLGKVLQGTTMDWDVWIEGSYEHSLRPQTPHAPVPEGQT